MPLFETQIHFFFLFSFPTLVLTFYRAVLICLRPITAGANNATKQPELISNTCNLFTAREKYRVQEKIGSGFPYRWLSLSVAIAII